MNFDFGNPNVDPAQAVSVVNQAVQNQWAMYAAEKAANHNITNAAGSALTHEDFKRYKQQIIVARREKLFGIEHLLSRGMVTSEEFTTTMIGVEKMNQFGEAVQSMGEITDENDDTDFTEELTPFPITSKGWSIQARQNKSYKRARGLDESTWSVANKLENMLFNGSPNIKVGSVEIWGYLTQPNRLTDTISDWSDFVTNGDKIIQEFNEELSRLLEEAYIEGSSTVMCYLAPNLRGSMRNKASGTADKNIENYLLTNNPELIAIEYSHKVPDNTMVLVEMSRRNLELSRASDIQTIPHLQTKGILSTQKFTTFAIIVPIFHDDRAGTLGLLTASPTGG